MTGPVLILDDDLETLDALGTFLRQALPDAEILSTDDPATAIGWIRDRKPRLVIADYSMPKEDGIAFLRRARAENAGALHVLMTAHAGEMVPRLPSTNGAVDRVLLKPLETEPFKDWLRTQFAR